MTHDIEKVIKELHDARRYLEDKEWSDRGASPHIDTINNVLALLKEQPEIIRCKDCIHADISASGLIKCQGYFRTADWYCADGERRTDDA